MKKLFIITLSILLISLNSCDNNKTYSEQFNKDKPFVSRSLDLNKTIDEIKTQEKGKLILEDMFLLKYAYEIGEIDSYEISYLFDEKGCYEIGIDGYFEFEKDAKNVVESIQKAMNESTFGKGTNDNSLSQWKNEDESISVELDYKGTHRGLFIATIFANN